MKSSPLAYVVLIIIAVAVAMNATAVYGLYQAEEVLDIPSAPQNLTGVSGNSNVTLYWEPRWITQRIRS